MQELFTAKERQAIDKLIAAALEDGCSVEIVLTVQPFGGGRYDIFKNMIFYRFLGRARTPIGSIGLNESGNSDGNPICSYQKNRYPTKIQEVVDALCNQ